MYKAKVIIIMTDVRAILVYALSLTSSQSSAKFPTNNNWRFVIKQDTVVFRQQTEGERPAEAAQFFYLNPDTGVITTKRFLTETTTKTFRV